MARAESRALAMSCVLQEAGTTVKNVSLERLPAPQAQAHSLNLNFRYLEPNGRAEVLKFTSRRVDERGGNRLRHGTWWLFCCFGKTSRTSKLVLNSQLYSLPQASILIKPQLGSCEHSWNTSHTQLS